MAYPYSKTETLADGAVHAAGIGFAVAAVPLLLGQANGNEGIFWAAGLYTGCLVLSLVASAVYHMTPVEPIRPLLHRIDHAAIYFKIAGTYTPFVALVGTAFAYGVLGLVWTIALLAALAKLSFWEVNARGSLMLYLGLGWLSILLIWPMWTVLPGAATALVVAGGITYSAGTLIYAHPGMPYQNALWHLVVLAASICFFVAVTLSL
ncbi:MAG: hemolysin III [Sulfitobacter sp.]|nr:hemolysin III [Sulfitobacter sp.]